MLNEFIAFEEQNNLFEKVIQDIYFWPFIRFELYREIVTKKNDLGEMHTQAGENRLERLLNKVAQLPGYFMRNPLWNLRRKDVLIFNHSRRVKQGHFYECLFTEDLVRSLPYSYYVMEKPYLKRHFKPVLTKNLKYLENIYFLGIRKKRYVRKKYLMNRAENSFIESLIEDFNRMFNVQLDQSKWKSRVQTIIFDYHSRYDAYHYILNKVQPKVLIQVVSYSFENLMFNEIAHKIGIPVIELQHGFIGNYLPYVYQSKGNYQHHPDYLFCFGQYWKDVSRLPINKKNIIVTGASYYEKKKKTIDIETKKNKEIILFLSQGIIGKRLSKIALSLAQILNLNKYEIIYKLHPGEYHRWKKEYPWLITAPFEIIDHNERDLYYYLQKADYQIGVGTTAIFEGLGLGLKTFIYKDYGHQMVEALYKNNYAVLFTSVEELYSNIINVREPAVITDYFWETHSIENMIKEIEKIISKKKIKDNN
ncbi:hypothetical protein AB3Z07_24510 [Metabacillus halosaccharovorans]|uniref:hypothetical protein n=1 Tax=Metabacillus halosaccharovorans TaxID=930124 RepID=UPI0034CD3A3A